MQKTSRFTAQLFAKHQEAGTENEYLDTGLTMAGLVSEDDGVILVAEYKLVRVVSVKARRVIDYVE
jgi:hypothetical protein